MGELFGFSGAARLLSTETIPLQFPPAVRGLQCPQLPSDLLLFLKCYNCSSFISVAVTDSLIISNLGKKGLTELTIWGYNPLLWGPQGRNFKVSHPQERE